MNRGSLLWMPAAYSPLCSFNEAPIHESGKSDGLLNVLLVAATCFNEAPIHESGKYGVTRSNSITSFSLQ